MKIQAAKSLWSDPGNCYYAPDMSGAYINIPKNASTWTLAFLKSQGWSHDAAGPLSGKVIVSLRDPADRWTCGIAEYLNRYHPTLTVDKLNRYVVDLIFERVVFDPHTEKQIQFVDGLDTEHTVFFKVDSNYSVNIAHYLNIDIEPHLVSPSNTTADNANKTALKSFFRI